MNIRQALATAPLLALALAGCTLPAFLRGGKQPTVRDELGIAPGDERFREVTPEALDADLARPRNGLRLVIRTDKQAYNIGEPIIVDIRLENVSGAQSPTQARDIPVYFEPLARTRQGVVEWLFKFQIRRDADQRIIYQSPNVKVPLTDRAQYYHHVTLPPHSFVGRRFVLWPSRARGLMQPGSYALVATYVVDDDSAYVIINRHLTAEQVQIIGQKLAYVRVWTGQLFSNRVVFRVKRKRWLGIF